MLDSYKKYRAQYRAPEMKQRLWPAMSITHAPRWCSVDLRDGNQALVNPMDVSDKLMLFSALCRMGFKEIEVGFPSSNDTEYEMLRALISRDLIPEDVYIQVLSQCREQLVRRTFDSFSGAKRVIMHLYSATSELMRRVVFHSDKKEIINLAAASARLCRELAQQTEGTEIIFEYSPEHFTSTEPEFAVELCESVMEAFGASSEQRVIINLPSSVELSTPNIFADQVEYFIEHLSCREHAIISVHTHNDRGTGVAASELALLAGAQRVEGTIFGNGERTGNADLITLAMNLYSLGIDPGLDMSDLGRIKSVYERTTGMHVHERQPYAGELVFTAFSGSHQDAIKKGLDYITRHGGDYWEVPYLPLCPADVGRQYEPIVRINSQSGKGGAAFIMQSSFGFVLPRDMHPEFGLMVKQKADESGRALSNSEVYSIFEKEYLEISVPYSLGRHKIFDSGEDMHSVTHFEGAVICHGVSTQLQGEGNGPIDAFFDALGRAGVGGFSFVSYHEHAISAGSDAKAVAYIELRDERGRHFFGVGIHNNTSVASIKGVLCAINRALASKEA